MSGRARRARCCLASSSGLDVVFGRGVRGLKLAVVTPPVLMDGLREDAEALFILTTNRPDHIEPALSRPGRIDQVIEFPLPDEKGRARLTRLYSLRLDVSDELVKLIASRTKGVSAAFIKELMRRCAQFQIEWSQSNVLAPAAVDPELEEMLFLGGRSQPPFAGRRNHRADCDEIREP